MTLKERAIYLEAENRHLKKLLKEVQIEFINVLPYHQMTTERKNLMLRIDNTITE